ncbi:MAG TPA: polysaccharide deacetylase family protein, partial [Gemmatimonadota bacterium]|nr:polysaccharide deacetylase family protein [Gemmatimonadota bacterium]
TAAAPERAVALTFDDLPMSGGPCDAAAAREITGGILEALAAADAPAVGFVNASRTCGEPATGLRDEVLEAWIDAGHDLGNHTWSHPDLERTPLAAYLEDVDRGAAPVDSLLRRRGRRLVWFRHPFLHAGDTPEKKAGLAAHLAQSGWRVAPVTVDNQEWVYAWVYQAALARADTALAARVADAYLDHVDDAFAYFEARSREVVGREVPQVLLLHANRLNADLLEQLLGRVRARGYRFVDLSEAMEDPVYAREDPYVGRGGPSWIERWGIAAGAEPSPGPREHPWVAESYQRLRTSRRRRSRSWKKLGHASSSARFRSSCRRPTPC